MESRRSDLASRRHVPDAMLHRMAHQLDERPGGVEVAGDGVVSVQHDVGSRGQEGCGDEPGVPPTREVDHGGARVEAADRGGHTSQVVGGCLDE